MLLRVSDTLQEANDGLMWSGILLAILIGLGVGWAIYSAISDALNK